MVKSVLFLFAIPRTTPIQSYRMSSTAKRFVSYKASPAPSTNRQRLRKRFAVATLGSASVVSLYYALNAPIRSAEAVGRDYSSTIRITDTAEHPRNYKMTVADSMSASAVLRTNEKSTYLTQASGTQGILSYHFNQVASNSPIEDDHVEITIPQTDSTWSFFGVFDGHSGWSTSDRLKRDLVPFVTRCLSALPVGVDVTATQKALKQGFVNLDSDIVFASVQRIFESGETSRPAAVSALMPAFSGSCGLLAFFDSASRYLHVAVTGDSRAIYASKHGKEWGVKALSEDQTGSTASEVARIKAAHPGEENVIRNGRILGGLEPSRAFGDCRYKWTAEVQSKIAKAFYGRRPPPTLLTPPYVTAQPEVTSTKIDTTEQGFLVLGTDGLYEMLTNEEIAELVITWRQKYDKTSASQSKSWVPSFFSGRDDSIIKIKNEDDVRTGQKAPHEQSKKQFVCEDGNVATHIIRNALGGGNTDRLYGLLSLPYPLSRSYRDDISVTVVFFGDGSPEGMAQAKPKL